MTDATHIMPGVSREEYHGFEARDVHAVSADIVIFEDGDGGRGYITLGPEAESYGRAAVYDARLKRWQVYPPADNDDFHIRKARPGA